MGAVEGFSSDKLNAIPSGFNNNLIWNLGHTAVTQQLLVYGRAGLPFRIDNKWIEEFRKGTAPSREYSESEIQEIKEFVGKTSGWLKEDFEQGKFTEYNKYETSYGVELNSVEDAIAFNNTHEAMHLGYIMSIRKLV